MAVLDARLLALVETLADAGADWLAFEIVEGIRRGREPLESEEMLQAAREKVRSLQHSDRLSAEIPVPAAPILGDDQIVWAAQYVFARLDGALTDLDKGRAMIEAVAETSSELYGQDYPAFSTLTPGAPLKITLIGQEDHPVDRDSIATARQGLVFLREALNRWVREAQGRATR